MSAQRTPVPWVWHEQGDANDFCLLTSEKRWVISFRQNGEMGVSEQRANAEFIVKACNAYDELVAALKMAIPKIGLYGTQEEFEQALNALSKAGSGI